VARLFKRNKKPNATTRVASQGVHITSMVSVLVVSSLEKKHAREIGRLADL
jgi:hypothetical protein